MSKTPALEKTEAILAGVAVGGRLDTQTAVFLGAGAVVLVPKQQVSRSRWKQMLMKKEHSMWFP